MRKILRVITVLTLIFLINSRLQAQLPGLPKVLAFGNVTYASPANTDFKNIADPGFGYEIGGGIGFGKTILIASGGHISYKIGNAGHLKVTPIKLGLRRYVLLGLFLNGSLGLAMQEYDFLPDKNSSLLYEVGAGYKLGFFEVGAAYTGYQLAAYSRSANSLLLKAGLAIKL